MHKLVISDDEGKRTVVPLVRDEITIGRKEGNTIRLTERNVSRRHARLTKSNGAFVVEDLKSYNGVRVNGRKIAETTPLTPGDQISIGDYQLALQAAGAEARPTVSTADTAMIEAPTGEPPARLVMLSPPAPGAEFSMDRLRVRLGRAEDLEVWVNHRSISREHAEVTREGDRFQIRDLGSSNGVRVNGQRVTAAPLEAGDLVELGQVRFRFVAPGESYIFDADQTLQVSPIEQPSSRAPMFWAAAIVLGAVAIATLVALGSDPNDPPAITIEPSGNAPEVTASPEIEPVPAPPEAVDAFDEALAGCQSALEAQRYEEAISHGTAAEGLDSGSVAGRECLTAAQRLWEQEQAFTRATESLGRGELDDAYFGLQELPPESPFRDRPEYSLASERYAGQHLGRCRELARTDPGTAIREAEAVLVMNDATPAQQDLARRCQRSARNRPGRPIAANTRMATTTREQPTATVEPAAEEEPEAGRGNPLRDCVAESDYNRCLIRRLGARGARSSNELAALIEAYRGVGDTNAALRQMENFVRRHPNARRANQYRQILSRYGRDPD